MAKFIAGLAMYVLVAGVAHAETPTPDSETQSVAYEAGVPVTDLMGAVASTGVGARQYARSEGLIALPQPRHPYGIWDRLAMCESSGNRYYGGTQSDMVAWVRYGGTAFAPRPDLATRDEQIDIDERILANQGRMAWPYCGPLVGLH